MKIWYKETKRNQGKVLVQIGVGDIGPFAEPFTIIFDKLSDPSNASIIYVPNPVYTRMNVDFPYGFIVYNQVHTKTEAAVIHDIIQTELEEALLKRGLIDEPIYDKDRVIKSSRSKK